MIYVTCNGKRHHCHARMFRRYILRILASTIDEYAWQQWAKLSLDHLGLPRVQNGLIFSLAGPSYVVVKS
jgi:hypothetical protein